MGDALASGAELERLRAIEQAYNDEFARRFAVAMATVFGPGHKGLKEAMDAALDANKQEPGT